jgi:hypothetical protein
MLPVIPINSGWLTNTGNILSNGSYALYPSGGYPTAYVLQQDVFATGTFTSGQEVFQFFGNQVSLDLNQHFVYANGAYYQQTQLSQKASHNVTKPNIGNVVNNCGGVMFMPNDTTVPIDVDPTRKNEYAISNPELF